MQPQSSAILKLLKEYNGEIPLSKVITVFGSNFNSLIFRLRQSVFYIEDGFLKMDSSVGKLGEDELKDCVDNLVYIMNGKKKDFTILIIVLVAAISFTIGFLISQNIMACDIVLDYETLTNIKCLN